MQEENLEQNIYSYLVSQQYTDSKDLEIQFLHKDLKNALNNLIEQKLISHDGKKYQALPAQTALSELKDQNTQNIVRLTAENIQLEKKFSDYIETYQNHKQAHDGNYKVLTTEAQTRELLIELGLKAKKTIRIMYAPPGFGIDDFVMDDFKTIELMEKSLTIERILPSLRFTPEQLKRIDEVFSRFNYSNRYLDFIPIHMAIYDEFHTILSLPSFPKSGEAYYFQDPKIAHLATYLFKSFHKKATPAHIGHTVLTTKELEERRIIFSLIFQGLEDKEVREHIGMPERTFRRKMHNYTEKVGAKNRAQLHLYAYEHNWHL